MSSPRARLGFAQIVREEFEFLGELGFREREAEDTIVRYESTRAFLNVYHGRSSYELGVEIGVTDSKSDSSSYSMSALIRLTDPKQAAQFRNTIATTPEELRNGLHRLAATFREHGEAALRGEPTVFAALKRQREDCVEEYAADVAYRQICPRADEAFRQHDYKKAAQLYESIRGKLSPAELLKLEYAKKRP